MRSKIRLASLAVLGGVVSTQAGATNGYFMHGYGIKAQGQAGVSIAQPQDALAAANNPAGTVWIGDRLDIGATLFAPDRSAEIEGNAAGANGRYDGSERKYFLLPEIGYSKQLNDRLGVGVAVYGNGGMNTDYKENPYAAFGGNGSAGVNLSQLFITPSLAYKFTERHSFGVGLNYVYQRFSAKGLNAFSGFSSDGGNFNHRGNDTSTGWGLRLGWQGRLTDDLTLGLTWSSKIKAEEFDRYAGLFADGGSFDIPENYGVGLAYKVTPALTVSADAQEIKYGSVRSIANEFDVQSVFAGDNFGSKNGPGFGWRDVTVYKLAVSYALSPQLTLRGGFSHADQPVQKSQTFLNVLAPGVIRNHLSVGLTWAPSPDGELSLAYTHGFKETVNGNGSIPAAFGGGEANVKMSQDILGIAYAWKF
ncbi:MULTISPECIES: OmpP1/FadL family transporter [Brenneria]|uniref:Long-chain fatty acid transporter n=1 Tax=Brenneria nigrifluens DSM 30175 = ATCC 13028 TaxID=1121120 RepID=A0A2U1UR61_9GAMM|nr:MULTISPECIES: outer membrane protein transport protein [Brenneria]EHD22331.1 membrane protein involved in aromatic hydrocarbon degradation [Brenneria sp. EniD312]PWC24153.1 long-chain fatty acid transporter [Brenneria nigrifluens DSM 30175 = ATCC 13028]QCR05345.1 long-chain fatty acid transporter [Brenneria nigrifluens DSM 30175 = ATCC 13028]